MGWAISFDCYGTLVDWERGVREALENFLSGESVERVLEAWLEEDFRLVQGGYRRYEEILREGLKRGFERSGVKIIPEAVEAVVESVGEWPPFPDTLRGLELLRSRGHRLYIISNIDVRMLEETVKTIGFEFDGTFTAEEAREYKPSLRVFEKAYKKFGVSLGEVIHVSFSPIYDLRPAKKLGLRTAYIKRKDIPLPGDLNVDYVADDLVSFAEILG